MVVYNKADQMEVKEIGRIELLQYQGGQNVDQQTYSCPSVEHRVPSWPTLASDAISAHSLRGLIVYPGEGTGVQGLIM